MSLYKSDTGRAAVHAHYVELLRRWPVPNQQHYLQTRHGNTFVITCGPPSAPPLLLLQGSGASAAMWLRDVEALAANHRVHAVDVIGEPGFSDPARLPLRSEAHASWLDDVLQALDVERCSLLGVSFGGWLVIDYATRRAERVDRIVVMNPSGIGDARLSFLFKAGVLTMFGRAGRQRVMSLAVGPSQGSPHPSDHDVGMLALLIAKHFRYRRASIPIFSDEQLAGLTMPMLAIVGARDALLDAGTTRRRLEQLVPAATVRWLPDAGHVVRNQTAAILDFLRDGPARFDGPRNA